MFTYYFVYVRYWPAVFIESWVSIVFVFGSVLSFRFTFCEFGPWAIGRKNGNCKGYGLALSAGKEKTIFIKAKEDMQMIRPN